MGVPQIQTVERLVEVPVNVPQPVTVHVPKPEVRERVEYVKRPQVQMTERIVHVPQIQQVERIVEVPEIRVEEYTRYVDGPVPMTAVQVPRSQAGAYQVQAVGYVSTPQGGVVGAAVTPMPGG